jgi:phosphoribosylglycinamide formyltransferase-1
VQQISSKKRVSVLISGRGSNLAALLDAAADPSYPASIVLVVANRADAAGLALAEAAGVKTRLLLPGDFPKDRHAYDAALHQLLLEHSIDLVCLAGFMRLLTAKFATSWWGKMLNIHPSLLPAFKGLHAQQQALEAGVKLAGCTVHLVSAEMDAGPIVAQTAVPVLDDDTEESLSQRILAAEHGCYPKALAWLASDRLLITKQKVQVMPHNEQSTIW